jgi:hypothetical protein
METSYHTTALKTVVTPEASSNFQISPPLLYLNDSEFIENLQARHPPLGASGTVAPACWYLNTTAGEPLFIGWLGKAQ